MSLSTSSKKPVQIFLFAVVVGITSLYLLCDYYLNSVGRELMTNWVRAEAVSIQEGNLLTSSTKNQRILFSSRYIRAVKLVKIDNEQVRERLHFGDEFEITSNSIPKMNDEVVVKRIGFLHNQSFYKIPDREEMFIIFDVQSGFLNSVFFGVSAMLLLMLIGLVAAIRSVERQEFAKRSELFAKENQSKILLGEIALRVGHDIIGLMRNIEVFARRTTGLNPTQTRLFHESIQKVSIISNDITKQAKKALNEETENISSNEPFDLIHLMKSLTDQKQIQFEDHVKIVFKTDLDVVLINNIEPIELERSLSNLISNAAEASMVGSEVVIGLQKSSSGHEIFIQDFGKGISVENLGKLGSKGFTFGKESGTGIGVFYAKQFIEGVGGDLNFESKLGIGTRVYLRIPGDKNL